MNFDKPESLTLAGLFSHRIFIIPNYQRPYRWATKHRKDLFCDIEEHFKKKNDEEKIHFMATIVGLQKGKQSIDATEHTKIDIIDGQQRITTLIILCKAISKELSDDYDQKRIKEKITELLAKSDGTTLLLQNNHEDNTGYFSKYIRDEGIPQRPTGEDTQTNKNILDAIQECEKFVKEWKLNKSVKDLYEFINNKIFFVYHEISKERLVYSVFELLNSRGLQVSQFDLLKTSLMNQVFENREKGQDIEQVLKEVHANWSQIFRIIGTSSIESEVLTFAATLYSPEKNKPRSEESSREYLVEKAKGEILEIRNTIKWIEDVAGAVYEIKINRERETKWFIKLNRQDCWRLPYICALIYQKTTERGSWRCAQR